MWSSLLTVSTLALGVLCLPTSNNVLHEKRTAPLPHVRRRVDPDAVLPMRIALKQANLHTGYDRLMNVSHPKSENYGKHLSTDEVHDIFAPAEESVNEVIAWLVDSGVNETDIKRYQNKGWLAIDMPAKQAEDLMSASFYEHDLSKSMRIGCDSYHLPARISRHIDFIRPGVMLSPPVKRSIVKRGGSGFPGGGSHWHRPPHGPPFPRPGWHMPPGAHGLPPDLQSCSVNITPPCIKALYDIPAAKYSQPENAMGVYETFDAFSQQDIDTFFAHFAPNVPQGTAPKVDSVDGGTAPVAPSSIRNGGESDIDLDLSFSLIYPQTVTVYQIDDVPNASGETNKTGFLNDWLDAVDGSYCRETAFGITGNSPSIDPVYPDPLAGGYKGRTMCGTYQLTRVVSISYGEAEYELPKPYVERSCQEIMKLGLSGHSIFVSSGDYGVASFPGSQNNSFGCLPDQSGGYSVYNPDYPSGCPYITAVGATRLYPNDTVKDPESAMQVNLTAFNLATGEGPVTPPYGFFATGGGFSNYFTPPSYQKAAVSNYLASHNDLPSYVANADATNIGANGGVYNRAGRGYPDVSANGAFLLASVNLTIGNWFGTSLSSPIFASVITLINEERTAAGKGPVGFVNTVLYEHPEVLNDITNGSNPNCGSAGFETSKGWDPVTGLGTPNYPKMLELFMGLP